MVDQQTDIFGGSAAVPDRKGKQSTMFPLSKYRPALDSLETGSLLDENDQTKPTKGGGKNGISKISK